MKKSFKKNVFIFALVFLFFSMNFISAIDLTIRKENYNEISIKNLNLPIIFNLEITNNGASDNFQFYNLIGFTMTPIEKIFIEKDETKNIEVVITPFGKLPEEGFYIFNYFIKDSKNNQIQDSLLLKIVDIGEVVVVSSENIIVGSNSVKVSIKNKENIDFGNVNARFYSPFFNSERNFTLGPRESKEFTFNLEKENFRDLTAGFYTLRTIFPFNEKENEITSSIRFSEKNILTTKKSEFGLLINTQIIEKENEGNSVEISENTIKKNIVSRLFTTFNPEPDIIEREGSTVYYTWIKQLNPGEKYQISIRTNWFIPFILIFLVFIILFFIKKYSKTDVVLKKKVSFVSAKGGEFALKVSLLINSKEMIERINVVDRLPPLVDIYERFGGETPSKIDKKNRRIEWNFEKLEPGETRIVSYMIYSKIGVMGKFALPTAAAIYEKDGKIHESNSNRAFFITEQKNKDDLES